MCSVKCTMFSAVCIVQCVVRCGKCAMLSAVCIVQRVVCSVKCAACIVQ